MIADGQRARNIEFYKDIKRRVESTPNFKFGDNTTITEMGRGIYHLNLIDCLDINVFLKEYGLDNTSGKLEEAYKIRSIDFDKFVESGIKHINNYTIELSHTEIEVGVISKLEGGYKNSICTFNMSDEKNIDDAITKLIDNIKKALMTKISAVIDIEPPRFESEYKFELSQIFRNSSTIPSIGADHALNIRNSFIIAAYLCRFLGIKVNSYASTDWTNLTNRIEDLEFTINTEIVKTINHIKKKFSANVKFIITEKGHEVDVVIGARNSKKLENYLHFRIHYIRYTSK